MSKEKVEQKKLDSLVAKYLHHKKLGVLNVWCMVIDFVAVAVPILYFVVRYQAKGTDYAALAEFVWEILAVLLLVMTVFKNIWKLQEKAQNHSKLMGENISITGLADNLLSQPETIAQNYPMFSHLVQKNEEDDRNILNPSDKDKKWAYREALKEFGGKYIKCPICNASPWNFSPGSCQSCGNTPNSLDGEGGFE